MMPEPVNEDLSSDTVNQRKPPVVLSMIESEERNFPVKLRFYL